MKTGGETANASRRLLHRLPLFTSIRFRTQGMDCFVLEISAHFKLDQGMQKIKEYTPHP